MNNTQKKKIEPMNIKYLLDMHTPAYVATGLIASKLNEIIEHLNNDSIQSVSKGKEAEKEKGCIHGHPKGYGCDSRCKPSEEV